MFQKNTCQSIYLGKTWQQSLKKREVVKNNYHATGSIKKAKNFVRTAANFAFQTNAEKTPEQIVFSNDLFNIPLEVSFVFAI